MHPGLLDILRCPRTGGHLQLGDALYREGRIETGCLISDGGQYRYPIINFIPRFVPQSTYADSFGFEWNKFRTTQLDSCSGHPISADRFWRATAWSKEDVAGKWTLDAGCGAGRFAEIALRAEAHLVAIDYSSAVDACYANLGNFPNLHVVQADIFSLPFAVGQFNFVYSLGVLQHTPDVHKAFDSLLSMLAGGGRICVDFYEKSWKSSLLPKYWLRPLTKHVPKARLLTILQHLVPGLLLFSEQLNRVPFAGGYLRRAVPVANYSDILPLDAQQQLEWSLLDTFDWLSPKYDNPQDAQTVRRWLEEASLESVAVLKAGHLVARGTAPAA